MQEQLAETTEVQESRRNVPSFASLARKLYTEASGDVDAATDALIAMLEADRTMLYRMVSIELEPLAKSYVARANCAERAAVMIQAARPAAAVALAAGMSRTLMDFPLAGGIKLKDATGQQVAEQAALYRATADDMDHKSRWLAAIAEKVPAHVSVGSVLTVDDVTKMFWGE